jgi:hypothetical protein
LRPAALSPIRPPGESKIVPFPGIVSDLFGIFRGDTKGPDRGVSQPRFSLVLLACGRFLSTSARRIDCQVLAEELAPLEVAWTATDPSPVTGPGLETARWLLQCRQRRYEF